MKADSKSHTGRIGVAGTELIFNRLGWIFREQPIEDYGIDAHVEIVENDKATGKLIALQIKCGDSWFKETTENEIVFRGKAKHLEYWQQHSLPVLVILYNDQEGYAYWQVVNKNTVQKTVKDWKLLIPLEQKVDESSKTEIEKFSKKLTPASDYTILSLRDVSHGLAKRYSANILLSKEFTKSEITRIIKDVTTELITRQYYRNKEAKQHWKGKNTHIIWLFLYLSLDDVSRTTWICRTQWISKELPPEYSPMRLDGELIDGEIIVDWNENYRDISTLLSSYEVTKEDYLDSMLDILELVKYVVDQISDLITQYDSGKLDESRYISLMVKLESELTKLYFEGTDVGTSPTECKDLSQQFQSLISIAHNIVLPNSEIGLKTWEKDNREYLVRQAMKDYHKVLLKLQFELEKVN
ncbi:MAG: DUF4365 domain-containing protein [Nostoc sp. NOS(2021)]|uniref:DUF4365 domain-containing protein n=1 Tax=Nostoc sp. NOS(2021) TaxID=2815407 RepID=UPI0025FCBD96|nr:DUF4365 domain-containing protein [Nostoc sp. NOS(2021)]MBN3898913.1 DUF4365 domain-containing protein [Nostoc sp. NOS(2021)]